VEDGECTIPNHLFGKIQLVSAAVVNDSFDDIRPCLTICELLRLLRGRLVDSRNLDLISNAVKGNRMAFGISLSALLLLGLLELLL
jgi:hypothetical protein